MPVSVTYDLINLTDPFRVNTIPGNGEFQSLVYGLDNGGFVTSFLNFSSPNASNNIVLDFYYGPNYTHFGTASSADPTPQQNNANFIGRSITQLTNGNILVTWEDISGSTNSIHGHLYTQFGGALGGELNLTPGVTNAIDPHVTARADGGFLLTWNEPAALRETSTARGNVFVAAYTASGNQLFSTQASRADAVDTSDYFKYNIGGVASELAGGGFVVTYDHEEIVDPYGNYDPTNDDHHDVRAVIFNNDGTVRKADFVIEASDDGVNPQLVSVALPAGNFAVVYRNDRLGGEDDTSGLTLRIITPNGGIGTSIHVNTPTPNADEYNPQINLLPNGYIFITWTSGGTSFGRIFEEHGNPITDQFAVSDQAVESVAHLSSGQFVTTWQETSPGEPTPGSSYRSPQIDAQVKEIVRSTTGTDAADILRGDELRDNIYAGAGADTVSGGGGNDFILGGAGNDLLKGDDGDDILRGGDDDDQLEGGNGNDTLQGEDGYDKLIGGRGDDTYILDSVSFVRTEDFSFYSYDTVTEAANEGTDTVVVSRISNGLGTLTSYVLPANVENGTIGGLASAGAFSLTGNELNNRLIGNNAANTLDGRAGFDTLTGGGGNDRFVFAPGYNTDVITDFVAGAGTDDRIDLTAFHLTFGAVMSHATQVGGTTIFDFGNGDVLALQNVQRANLSIDDFIGLEATARDFNADANSDFLWRNDNGAVVTWSINNTQIDSFNFGQVDLSWKIAGSGDFNGDARGDILWRNDNGQVVTWNMNNHTYDGFNFGNIDNSWKISGTGDFNGDGRDDILWRNDNGAVVTWNMNNHTYDGFSFGQVDNAWRIAGTGDFNGDGRSDILWRNSSTGAVVTWDMNNHTYTGFNFGQVDLSWKIAGTGDFNGDGKDDILWRNDNGQVVTWNMNDHSYVGFNFGNVDNSWKIASTGNYNGDGNSDILWRNDNGSVVTWNMNDHTHTDVSHGVVQNSWHIAA